MGWTSSQSWLSKKDVINEILRDYADSKIIRTESKAGAFYMAVKTPTVPEGIVLIFLIERHVRDWSYKGMSEDMGPTIANCSLEMIASVPGLGGEYSREWRARVVAYNKAKNQIYSHGDKVSIYGKPYLVLGKMARSYRVQSLTDGKIYRATSAKMQRGIDEEQKEKIYDL